MLGFLRKINFYKDATLITCRELINGTKTKLLEYDDSTMNCYEWSISEAGTNFQLVENNIYKLSYIHKYLKKKNK